MFANFQANNLEACCKVGVLKTKRYLIDPDNYNTLEDSKIGIAFPLKKDPDYDQNRKVYLLTTAFNIISFHPDADVPVKCSLSFYFGGKPFTVINWSIHRGYLQDAKVSGGYDLAVIQVQDDDYGQLADCCINKDNAKVNQSGLPMVQITIMPELEYTFGYV